MQSKHLLLAFVVAVGLAIITPRSEAQVVGGYVGLRSPGVVTYGSPVFAPAPMVAPPMLAAPVVPTTTVIAPSPWFGPQPRYYAPRWGYPTAVYRSRVVYPRTFYRAGPRWW